LVVDNVLCVKVIVLVVPCVK